MCSTPRRNIKSGKASFSGSLLSNISAEARLNFSHRANAADQRRYQKK
ncbi:MAG: hypothetical protein ACI9LM_002452 [Alteromonadaceae bacterium]|jgi:hypothetical protein